MLHLQFHPLTHLNIGLENELATLDIKEIWKDQTKEMHDLCCRHGESWAWEYLFKNWYVHMSVSEHILITNQVRSFKMENLGKSQMPFDTNYKFKFNCGKCLVGNKEELSSETQPAEARIPY